MYRTMIRPLLIVTALLLLLPLAEGAQAALGGSNDTKLVGSTAFLVLCLVLLVAMLLFVVSRPALGAAVCGSMSIMLGAVSTFLPTGSTFLVNAAAFVLLAAAVLAVIEYMKQYKDEPKSVL